MNLRAFVALGLIMLSSTAVAQRMPAGPTNPDKEGWYGKVALGYLATSGNTESSSLNTATAVNYASGRWVHTLEASAIHAAEDDETTAEAYGVGWKSEFSLSEHNYLFGRLNWRKDRFSGYDQQISESVGYGRRLIDTGTHFLSAEIGVGARQSKLSDGTMENEFIGRGGLGYRWKFSETAEFTQTLTTEVGAENTYLESISALKASLVGDLALVASYTIKNNSTVPAGRENTDTFSALSLEYGF